MTTGNDNNGNGNTQPEPPCTLLRLQERVVLLTAGINSLKVDVQALHYAQHERADKFANMFQIAMVGISEAINNQVRNALDVTAGQVTELLSALDKIAQGVDKIADKRIPDTAGHICTGLHGVAQAIIAHDKPARATPPDPPGWKREA